MSTKYGSKLKSAGGHKADESKVSAVKAARLERDKAKGRTPVVGGVETPAAPGAEGDPNAPTPRRGRGRTAGGSVSE
jgi:hypothetical protein